MKRRYHAGSPRAAALALAASIAVTSATHAQSVFGRLHVENGLTWIGPAGTPYTGSAALQIAFSLAPGATDTTTDLRPEQNLLVGPLAGARFVNMPSPVTQWEAFGGVQASTRLLRTVAPLDVVVALDATVGTERRVITGASAGLGLRQRFTVALRGAYDWKHRDPTLALTVALPLFAAGGERRADCPSAFTVLRTRADSIAFQAFTLSRGLSGDAQLPRSPLPPSVSDLASFATFMRSAVPERHLPNTLLDAAFFERVVRRALRLGTSPLPAGWDSRATAEAILLGWQERIRMEGCLP